MNKKQRCIGQQQCIQSGKDNRNFGRLKKSKKISKNRQKVQKLKVDQNGGHIRDHRTLSNNSNLFNYILDQQSHQPSSIQILNSDFISFCKSQEDSNNRNNNKNSNMIRSGYRYIQQEAQTNLQLQQLLQQIKATNLYYRFLLLPNLIQQ